MTLPYYQGVSEKLRRIFAKFDVKVYFKTGNTLRDQLVAPKDKLDMMSTAGAVYDIPCLHCEDHYIGESGRLLGTRVKEHKRAVRLDTVNA